MPLPLPPTILLAVGGLLLVAGPWMRDARWGAVFWLAAWFSAAYLLATSGLVPMDSTARMALRSVWAADELAVTGQGLALAFGLMFGVGSLGLSPAGEVSSARFGFLSFLVAGVMLVTAANDAISLALSLEIIQFASQALLRMERVDDSFYVARQDHSASSPRGETCLWLGIVASVCVWLGIALGASVTASTQFDEVRMVLADAYSPGPGRVAIGAGSKLGLLAIGLIVTGLSYRIGLVPWQTVLVETVRGCGYWTSGCILMGGQLAGVMALARLCGTVWIGFTSELTVLLIVLSGATFVVAGGLAARGLAVGAGTLRRWLTAFVMLHAAWLLVGVIAATADLAAPENSLAAAAGQPGALSILLFSTGATLFGLSGLYLLLSHLARGDRDVEYLDELLGLGQLAPAAAVALMIILASLIGHPPLWGCWGQWLLLVAGFNVRAAVGDSNVLPNHGVIALLLVATLSTLLVATVVIRFARVMFLEEPVSRTLPQGGRASLGVGVFAALILVALGLFPSKLLVPLSGMPEVRPVVPLELPAGKKSGTATVSREE
jgi:NADH-quinone oxidoreductase subunit N